VRGCNQRTLRCIGLGTVAGNAFVADLPKKLGTIACPRCEAPMEEVVRIAPAQNGPGLIGYECPSCNYVTSVLTPSKSPRRPQGRPKQSLSEVQEPTHFTFRIDTWTAGGESVIEHVAGAEDYQLALATFRAACERWPGTPITLRQGARVIEDSRRLRMASWSDKGRQGGR
jgi:transposase-like protein